MATISFSVSDHVKERFDVVFEGQDKSAVLRVLLIRAIEDEERRLRSSSLVERLRRLRGGNRTLDEGVGSAG